MPRLCTLLLLSIAVLLATARPTFFETELFEKDGQNMKRQAEEGSDNVFEEYSLLPNVVLLDELKDLLHVECGSTDIVLIYATGFAPLYDQGTVFLGGREWNCTDVNGTADSVVIRGDLITRQGDEVHVQGGQPTLAQVFANFTMIVNKTEANDNQKRDQFDIGLGSYNYNSYTGSANEVLPMFYQDCNSGDLSRQAMEFCVNGGQLNNSVQCTNCYVYNHAVISVTFSSLSPSLNIVVQGKMVINTDLWASSVSMIQKSFPSLLQFGLPVYGRKLFAGLDFGVDIDVEISADFLWKNTGNFDAGGQIVIDYGTYNTNPYATAQFFPSAPEGGASGESSVRIALDVGPRMYLIWGGISIFDIDKQTIFDAKFSVQPWIQLGVAYQLPAFPAKIAPAANDSIFFAPIFGSACTSPHFLEWNITVGVKVLLTFQDTLFFKYKQHVLLDKSSSLPLAKGCLLTDKLSGIYKKVKFYFDKKVTELNLSGMSFQALLLQDLKKVTRSNVEGNVTVTVKDSVVEAVLTLPNYNDGNSVILQNAADHANAFMNIQSRSTLAPYIMSTPVTTSSSPAFLTDGGYAQVTGAAGVLIPGIITALVLFTF